MTKKGKGQGKGSSLQQFARRLRVLREDRGMSQLDVATGMGVEAQVYSRYECGRNYPRVANLLRLVELLETSLDYLMFGE